MSRTLRLLLLTTVGLLAPAADASAQPDPADTRLLTMPAVGPDYVAFVYADDLWVAGLDGKNARRLTADTAVESYPVHSNTAPGERLYDKETVPGGLLGAD
ncbi:MAG TPA: hypothetical protein VMZ71_17705 [Gemmataceae bacterium]|nr:hypothetical protein [Gemmataceae bacterium]